MKQLFLVLVCVSLALACRSAAPDVALEGPVAGGVSGGIGCDVCAIALVVDATMSDADATPLSGVEVWWIPPPSTLLANAHDREFLPVRARRLGVTNGEGRLRVPECLMGGSEFRFSPPGSIVRLEFMLFREGYGAIRAVEEVPSGELLHTGYVLGKPMGDPLKDGYVVKLAKTLHKAG